MDKEQKNLKVFGYGLAVILGFIAWRLTVKGHGGTWPLILSTTGIFLALMTAIDYTYLRPFYAQWMRVAHLIGTVIMTVVLSLVFFLVFGLVGIFLRLLRKDLLSQKLEPDRESYWIKREKEEFFRDRYTKQF